MSGAWPRPSSLSFSASGLPGLWPERVQRHLAHEIPDSPSSTIAWLNRCRRLAKDWECLNRSGLAFLRWASVRLMLRKLCPRRK
ncbi:protein of unknown function [Rhodovastum atsumiense]|nr:protein of unknown function [Rhodovastum atsumiense]